MKKVSNLTLKSSTLQCICNKAVYAEEVRYYNLTIICVIIHDNCMPFVSRNVDFVGRILYPGLILLVEFFIQVGCCWWNSLSTSDIVGGIIYPGRVLLEELFILVDIVGGLFIQVGYCW